MNVTITINGQPVSREIEPRLLLVHFIRDVLSVVSALTIFESKAHHVQYLKRMEKHSFVRICISESYLDLFKETFVCKGLEQEYLGIPDRLLEGDPL